MSDLIDELKNIFPGSRSAAEITPVEVISTGLPSLDNIVLGCGGLPRGRTIEIYAKPSLGKTTAVLNWIANCQKNKGNCVFFDAEGALQGPEYTDGIGLNRDDLFMPEFTDGDNCLYIAKQLIALNLFDIMAVDSVKMLKPRSTVKVEDDSPDSMHDNFARAKMLSVFYQDIRGGFEIWTTPTKKGEKKERILSEKEYFVEGKWTNFYHKLTDKKTCFIMINHQMDKQGVMFGSKVTTAGGDSQKFDASIRLRITNKKKSKKKDKYGTPDYRMISIQADKNKLAPPFRKVDFIMMKNGELLELSDIDKTISNPEWDQEKEDDE